MAQQVEFDDLLPIRIRPRYAFSENNNMEHDKLYNELDPMNLTDSENVILSTQTDLIQCPLPVALCCDLIAQKYKNALALAQSKSQEEVKVVKLKPLYLRKLTSRGLLMVLQFCKAQIISGDEIAFMMMANNREEYGQRGSDGGAIKCPVALDDRKSMSQCPVTKDSPLMKLYDELRHLPVDYLCEVSAAAHHLGVSMLVVLTSKIISKQLSSNTLSDVTSSMTVEQGLSKAEENMIRRTFLKNHLALAGIDYDSLGLERNDGELLEISEIPDEIASLCPKLRKQLKLDDTRVATAECSNCLNDPSIDNSKVDQNSSKKSKKKKKKRRDHSANFEDSRSVASIDLGKEAMSSTWIAGETFKATVREISNSGFYMSYSGMTGFLPMHQFNFTHVSRVDVGVELDVVLDGFIGDLAILRMDTAAKDDLVIQTAVKVEKLQSDLSQCLLMNESLLRRISDIETDKAKLSITVQDQERQIRELQERVFRLEKNRR